MIEILPSKTDNKKFIGLVEQILHDEVKFAQPEDIFITKVDHWFDFKWRGFSHKTFGELGVWRDPLRIPPFIPDRIIEEVYYQKIGKSYERNDHYRLHIYQNSAENAERKINRKSAVYIWFSGETANNSQGSLMIYRFGKDIQNSWYASFIKKVEWQIYKTDNISKAEINSMIENENLTLTR
jgi:hypothetical protein